MKFKKVQFPAVSRMMIERMGGKALEALLCDSGANRVGVLVSLDLVQGKLEKHMSVSASSKAIRRMPRKREVEEAMKAVGFPVTSKIVFGESEKVVHVYER